MCYANLIENYVFGVQIGLKNSWHDYNSVCLFFDIFLFEFLFYGSQRRLI